MSEYSEAQQFNNIFKDKVNQKTTKQDLFDIVLVLDRSGSMNYVWDDAVSGVNTFIEEQQKEGGNAFFSMVQFDDLYGDPQYWRTPLAEVKFLTRDTYRPRGSTALLDAVGKTIAIIRDKRANGEMTGKVQLVVQTDGGENASQEYKDKEVLSKMIGEMKEEGWGDVLFLGTNIDSFDEASSMGVRSNATVNYANTRKGLVGAMRFASASTKSFRYGSALDEDDINLMQESVAAGEDISDLYTKIDTSLDRGEDSEDTSS